jgi:hypothetical protein
MRRAFFTNWSGWEDGMAGFTKIHGGLRKPRSGPNPGFRDATGTFELRAGDRCFRVEEDDDGMPALFEAAYLGKGQGTCHFRHPVTGEHWRESGMHWHGKPRDAFQAYIHALVSMLNAPETWLRISDCSREDQFRRLVRACAQLDALERHAPV